MRRLPLATDTRYYVSLGDAQSRNPVGVVGAASGFYQRLVSRDRAIKMVPLATDGATAATVRYVQLPRLLAMEIAPSVVTLTLGTGDMLRLAGGDTAAITDLHTHGAVVFDTLHRVAPGAVMVVATFYDAMDWRDATLAAGVARFNDTLRELAARHGARVADVHAAFVSHGADAGDPFGESGDAMNAPLYLCMGSGLMPHPNQRGAAVFADTLFAAYNELPR